MQTIIFATVIAALCIVDALLFNYARTLTEEIECCKREVGTLTEEVERCKQEIDSNYRTITSLMGEIAIMRRGDTSLPIVDYTKYARKEEK